MRQIVSIYKNVEFGQQAVAQLPWGHNVVLIDKIKEASVIEWYAQQAIEIVVAGTPPPTSYRCLTAVSSETIPRNNMLDFFYPGPRGRSHGATE